MIEVQAKKEAWSKDLLWLAGILLAALVLRLVAFSSFYQLDPEAIRSPDSATYEGPALAFVAHGKFLDRPNTPDVPMLLRTPGYPAFIAAVYAVFGANEEALIVVQIVVSLGTIFLVWWIGRMLWPGAVGLLAAAWLALDYLSLYYSQLLLSETLFALFLTLTLALGVRLILQEKPGIGLAVLFGVALSLTTHVRPITYYAAPVLFLGIILARSTWKLTLAHSVRVAFSFLLPWILLVVGWQVRNKVVAGTSQFSGAGGVILCLFHGASSLGVVQGISFDEARQIILRRVAEKASLSPAQFDQLSLNPVEPRVSGVSQAELYTQYNTLGAAILKENIAGFVTVMAGDVVPLLFGPGLDSVLKMTGTVSVGNPLSDFRTALNTGSFDHFRSVWLEQEPGTIILLLFAIVQMSLLAVLAILGIVLSVRDRGRRLLCHCLLVGAVLYMLALALGIGHSRHRMPCIPVLALYAGYSLQVCLMWVRRSRVGAGVRGKSVQPILCASE